jgi:hypothetical protein
MGFWKALKQYVKDELRLKGKITGYYKFIKRHTYINIKLITDINKFEKLVNESD